MAVTSFLDTLFRRRKKKYTDSISNPCKASQLSWDMCRSIVVGIARGLRYLHEESGLQVVHLNIKPSNIFLDKHFQPKIMGFDAARLIQDGENEAESTRLVGTVGYVDPHFIQTLRFSAKSDVYTFGVTILTLVTRRSICSWEEGTLIQYTLRCWTSGEAIDVIDEVMRKQEKQDSISEILRYIHIALLCVDVNPETKPSIDEVLHWFSCLSTPLPEPRIGNQSLVEEEINWLLSPSPGYGSPMSPVSPR
ncbi:Cysteine-rich receptor-like protein kinase 45 [Hirschfeldia incana]|nr:Cysteine-rich receptor-like protein kinase 45 [Hirschfeldia incana]